MVKAVVFLGESLNGWNALLLLACGRKGLAALDVRDAFPDRFP